LSTVGKAPLNEHTRAEIDQWVAKFPPGRQRSATIAALRAAQEQNHGYLTSELMNAVAEYLHLPPIQVYEVASFYSMFELAPCGRHHVSICTNISCMLRGGEDLVAHAERKARHSTGRVHARRAHFAEEGRGVPRRLHGRADDDGRSCLP
jgi:NADH-quinone oxidoreductase subunit E